MTGRTESNNMTIQFEDQFVREFLESPSGRQFADLLEGSTQLNQILDNLENSYLEYQVAADLQAEPEERVKLLECMEAVDHLREGFVTSLVSNLEKLSEIQEAHSIDIDFICEDNARDSAGIEEGANDLLNNQDRSTEYHNGNNSDSEMSDGGYASHSDFEGDEETETENADMMDFLNQSHPVPLPLKHLNLTKLLYCPMEESSNKTMSPELCVVCYDGFKVGNFIRVLPCQHRYHQTCIDTWFEQSPYCPSCKRDLRDLREPNTELSGC